MEATSYRASVVHYVQGDRVIVFQDGTLLEKLSPARVDELKLFIAQKFGFDTSELDEETVRDVMAQYPDERQRLDTYVRRLQMAQILEERGDSDYANELRTAAIDIRENWLRNGYLQTEANLPSRMERELANRRELPSKYDPFRLAVEHASLENECLSVGPGPNSKRPFVPFSDPDHDLIHSGLIDGIGEYSSALGTRRIGLIRNFKLCFYTFGFSRVGAAPVLPDRHNTSMPVRLNLFPAINVSERQANPIYSVMQENEAIYVQLEEETVRRWLLSLNCAEADQITHGPLGAALLSNVFPMTAYLDNLPKREEGQPPSVYLATYTLLHTYAHHLVHSIIQFAGLDSGSLSEYIFPCDLAFVVYRNGMTMDLGNISAMWRNNGRAFLDNLLIPTSLNCGLGTLCTERGGACPNCIMVPEVTCIAQNRLLSRSILNGDGRPEEDGVNEVITGYFEVSAAG